MSIRGLEPAYLVAPPGREKNPEKKQKIVHPQDARTQKDFTIDFSEAMKKDIKLLRQFLKENFYTTTPIARMDMKSQRVVEELFSLFMDNPKLLPMNIRTQIPSNASDQDIAETVCDYIANMTDMMALEEHNKLFNPLTRF